MPRQSSTKVKRTRPKKGLIERARELSAQAAKKREQHYRKRREKLFKRLRGKLPKYISDADLRYAIRVLLPPDLIEGVRPSDDALVIKEIKARFDFKAKREPLAGEHMDQVLRVLSKAIDEWEAWIDGHKA